LLSILPVSALTLEETLSSRFLLVDIHNQHIVMEIRKSQQYPQIILRSHLKIQKLKISLKIVLENDKYLFN
tara:strand:- start:119 stop:331 length:213 start_codon:yes stop_codon:yes gene_type:complete